MAPDPEPSRELDATGRALFFQIRNWMKKLTGWDESYRLVTNQACIFEQRARAARATIPRDSDGRLMLTITGAKGNDVAHPNVSVAERSEREYLNCLRELGLTPRALAKLDAEIRPAVYDPLADAFGD